MAITTLFHYGCAFTCFGLLLVQTMASSIVTNSKISILDNLNVLATKHRPVVDPFLYRRTDVPLFKNNTLSLGRNESDLGDDVHRYNAIEHGFTTRLNLTDPFNAWDKYQLAEPFPFWTKNMRSVMESNTSEWFMLFLDNYAKMDSFQCRQRGLSQ